MARLRALLGLLAALVLLGSAGAHALLGWPAMRAPLAALGATPALLTGVAIAWLFGSAAIATFGLIAFLTFADRLRGRPASTRPTLVIALVYVAFGIGAYAVSRDPFYVIFVGPGLLLLGASAGAASGRDAR